MKIKYAGLSDKGRVRENNEDNWAADLSQGLFIVSDGIGGHAAGEIASKIVVETLPLLIKERFQNINDLTKDDVRKQVLATVSELSQRVFTQSQGQPGLSGMGATLVMALIRGEHAMIVHLGDSRVYLFRQGQLQKLTKDHTVVQLLLDNGEITLEEALRHPAQGQLTRCVGMPQETIPEASVLKIHPEDKFLLCSDGLTGMVSDEQLKETLAKNQAPKAMCQKLIADANNAGGKDNITNIVITVLEQREIVKKKKKNIT